MRFGYARVSMDKQDTTAQVAALKAAKCMRPSVGPVLGTLDFNGFLERILTATSIRTTFLRQSQISLACASALHYKVTMRLSRYLLAGTEVLLISPAVLFMTALFARNLQPVQFQPAHAAQQIVTWYAERPHIALWLFLMAFPLAVLVSGCVTLVRRWRQEAELRQTARDIIRALEAHWEMAVVALTTTAAAGVLAIVALHVATD